MPATYPPSDALVVARVAAGAARYCAEHLANGARDAKRVGDTMDAALLRQTADALHDAGWTDQHERLEAARKHLEVCAELGGRLPTTTVSLPGELADALLVARGWRIETISSGGRCYVKPGRKGRADGGVFGVDYLWEGPEALELALAAEALEVNR